MCRSARDCYSLAAAGLIGLAVNAVSLPAFAEEGWPSRVEAVYSVQAYAASLLPVVSGTFQISTSFSGDSYSMSSSGELSGLTSWRGQSRASGAIAGGEVVPAAFTMQESDSEKTKKRTLAFANGDVEKIVPPLKTGGGRVPVKESQLKNVVDPLSALIELTSGVSKKPVCGRKFSVFDGQARVDVVLKPAGKEYIELPNYSGTAIVCSARYVPVSGHKAEAPGVKALAETNIRIWMVRMDRASVYAPLKITAENTWLSVEIVQERFRVSTSSGQKLVMQ